MESSLRRCSYVQFDSGRASVGAVRIDIGKQRIENVGQTARKYCSLILPADEATRLFAKKGQWNRRRIQTMPPENITFRIGYLG